MLKDIDIAWVILPFIIGAIVYLRVVKHNTGDPLRDRVKGRLCL